MWWSNGRRGRRLDGLLEYGRIEKGPINCFESDAIERGTPCVRNVVVVVRGKRVIPIKGLLVG